MTRLRAAVLAVTLALGAGGAWAHHGWANYSNEEARVSGVVEEASLGAPHGVVRVRNAQGLWDVMLAPPAAIQARSFRRASG